MKFGWSRVSSPEVLRFLALSGYPAPQAAMGLLLCSMSLWFQARDRLGWGWWVAGLAAGYAVVQAATLPVDFLADKPRWVPLRVLAAPRRLQAHQPVAGSRNTDRATAVVAMRDRHRTGRDERGRAR